MKKITMIAAVAVLALSFASCKKERVCECTMTSSAAGSVAQTKKVTYTKAKKDVCEKNSGTQVQTAPAATTGTTYETYTQTCTLK